MALLQLLQEVSPDAVRCGHWYNLMFLSHSVIATHHAAFTLHPTGRQATRVLHQEQSTANVNCTLHTAAMVACLQLAAVLSNAAQHHLQHAAADWQAGDKGCLAGVHAAIKAMVPTTSKR